MALTQGSPPQRGAAWPLSGETARCTQEIVSHSSQSGPSKSPTQSGGTVVTVTDYSTPMQACGQEASQLPAGLGALLTSPPHVVQPLGSCPSRIWACHHAHPAGVQKSLASSQGVPPKYCRGSHTFTLRGPQVFTCNLTVG